MSEKKCLPRIGRDIFLVIPCPPEEGATIRVSFFTGRFRATPGAIETYGEPLVRKCLRYLRRKARLLGGLGYLQIFRTQSDQKLWILDDTTWVVALLPTEY